MRKNIILSILLLQYTIYAQSQGDPEQSASTQTVEIKGYIHDSSNNGVIEFATVGLYRINDSSLVTGVVTDVNGSFSLKGVPTGEYYLDANFLGYVNKKIPVVISQQSGVINLDVVELNPDVTEIGAVEVIAQSHRVEYKVDKKVINVTQDITSSGGSLVNVLENTPSVEVDVEGNVSLRGSGNFQLLIDGKPSIIQSSEGLQQIPASAVQSLEIITSPSAKYDPDGEAGIINVIMKKQKNSGIGGVVNLSAGTRHKYSGDLLLNLKRNKMNYYIGGEYSDQQFYNKSKNDRRTYINDTATFIRSSTEGIFWRKSMNLKAGFDYSIGENSTLSLSGTIGNRNFNRDFESLNRWNTSPATKDSFYIEDNRSVDKDDFYNINLDFQKRYKDPNHKLEASIYFSSQNEDEKDEEQILKTNGLFIPFDVETERTRYSIEHPENEIRIELDYTRPIGRAKIEAGLQSRWDKDKANYIYENYNPLGSEWLRNDSISNSLNYLNALQSAYLTWSAPLGKFEYQAGLRLEYDNRNLEQKTLNESYTYEKLHLFPSVFITRKISDKHQIQFSYSRRIQRPRERDLNPFREFRGSNNVFFGNPSLKPEFTNALELNYQYSLEKGFISLETYYRATYDKITQINGLDTISGRPVFTFTTTNADKDYALGVELMANVDITKWWQLNLTGNLFRYQLKGEIDGEEVTSTSTSWRTNHNSIFKLKWDTRFQVTTIYNGPSNTLQGSRKGFFVTNIALRKELLKKQLTVSLNARDIFSTSKFSFISEGKTFYTSNNSRREAPVVMINLTYRINNYKQNGNRRSNGGENDNGGMEDIM